MIKYYLFVNDDSQPFTSRILDGIKIYETRKNSNLCRLIGERVYIVKSGKGKQSVIVGECDITDVVVVDDIEKWEKYRESCCIDSGSDYDYKTGRKYLYHVQNVSKYPEQIPLRKGITSVFGSYGYYKG